MIIGKYKKHFRDADMGMLQGASLNAPYKFHWVFLTAVEDDHIACTGAREEMRLPYRTTPAGDRAKVTVQDPIFGPIEFEVHPFLQDGKDPVASPSVTEQEKT